MCGITGFWNLDGRPVKQEEIVRFSRAVAHRGPDDRGIYVDPDTSVGLGHYRLAILDLSQKGRQPMSYGNGRYWIVYNGEIYNFVEIRADLEKRGHRFTTKTDTEVILAAYSQWGPQCQLVFNGMWAFAIWDRQDRTFFLSRDRFGIKPLYYCHLDKLFAFASEMKAFLSLERFQAAADFEVISASLGSTWHTECRQECMLRDVRRLLPGHSLVVRGKTLRVSRWWNTLHHLPDAPKRYEDQVEKFRHLFEDSCRLRLRSDVPVVSCLSGGLDSSAVVSTISGKRSGWVAPEQALPGNDQRVFVATFPGAVTDERAFADLVIKKSKAIPTYCSIDRKIDAGDIDKVLWDCEDIFCNLPLAIWLTYQSVREQGLYVTVDGHGGDELLAGYPQHVTSAVATSAGLLHPFKTADLLGIWKGIYGAHSQWPRGNMAAMVLRATPVVTQMYSLIYRLLRMPLQAYHLLAGTKKRRWLKSPTHLTLDTDRIFPEMNRLAGFYESLYGDFHVTVLPTLLRVFDRASMAHGVEIRMPFLDWRLVTFCFALPMESKLHDGFTKRILRSATKETLPEEIRARKHKVGFASPMHDLFIGPLSEWVMATLESETFRKNPLWQSGEINRFCREHMESGTWDYHSAEKVWPYLNASRWLDLFINRRSG